MRTTGNLIRRAWGELMRHPERLLSLNLGRAAGERARQTPRQRACTEKHEEPDANTYPVQTRQSVPKTANPPGRVTYSSMPRPRASHIICLTNAGVPKISIWPWVYIRTAEPACESCAYKSCELYSFCTNEVSFAACVRA